MDLSQTLIASYEGDVVIIEPRANGDWMYVLGCSAPCSVAEERMGHYVHCYSITIDLDGRSLAVVALEVHYKDGKNTSMMQVALKVERRDGHAYVDLQNRSSRILKRMVHVAGPYEMRVRLPVGEPYNGEWLSTMTDEDARQWRHAGRGCQYVDPVTACRYLAEEIDEVELLEAVEGESQADKMARLEKENADLMAKYSQASEFATALVKERDRALVCLQQLLGALNWEPDVPRPKYIKQFDRVFMDGWLEYLRCERSRCATASELLDCARAEVAYMLGHGGWFTRHFPSMLRMRVRILETLLKK